MRRFFLFLAVAFLMPGPARAARLSLIGLANSAEPSQPGTDFQAMTAYGGGVLLEVRPVPFIGLEIGALYAPRKFSFGTTSPTTANFTVVANGYEFPALLRLHMGRVLSFGIGGYYARTSGGTITLITETNGTTTSQSVTTASQNTAGTDYGLVTSLALAFRMGPLTNFLVDARYLLGLKNTSLTAGGTRKFNDMELLAGLQFGF